jgi:hypothetical protein
LIVATRRHKTSALKAKKDLAQAEILFEALYEDRPGELADALIKANASGPAWRDAIIKSMGKSEKLREISNALIGHG